MRNIKAVFEISEDSNLAGVRFKQGNKTIQWQDLTRLEQIKILNAWSGHWGLFKDFLKEE